MAQLYEMNRQPPKEKLILQGLSRGNLVGLEALHSHTSFLRVDQKGVAEMKYWQARSAPDRRPIGSSIHRSGKEGKTDL